MALKMNYQRFGATFTDAYFQVSVIQTNKANGYTVVVQVYFTAAVAQSAEAIANLNYQVPYTETIGDPAGSFVNPIAFAYGLLKTLPEYASAVDV